MPNKDQTKRSTHLHVSRLHSHVCDGMIKSLKTRSQTRQQWSRARSFVREVNTPWERRNFDQNRGKDPYV